MHKLTSSLIIPYVRLIILTKVKIIYVKYRNFSPKKKIWILLGKEKNQKKSLDLNHGITTVKTTTVPTCPEVTFLAVNLYV